MRNLLFLSLSFAAAAIVAAPGLLAQEQPAQQPPQPVAATENAPAQPAANGGEVAQPAQGAQPAQPVQPAQPAAQQPVDATANLDQVPPVTRPLSPRTTSPIRPRPGMMPPQAQAQQQQQANAGNPAAAAAVGAAARESKMVDNIDMPQVPITDVIALYESLTGYNIIRDPNLQGPALTISIKEPMPKDQAIAFIENTMLLGTYTIIKEERLPNTITIAGPGLAPSGLSIVLYSSLEKLLADNLGDRVSRFFRPLKYISPDDAMNLLNGVMQASAIGKITPAPSVNALFIVEKTPFIMRALEILDIIDVEPAEVVTRFIPLIRANAGAVVETLNQIFLTSEAPTNQAQQPRMMGGGPQGMIRGQDGRFYPNPAGMVPGAAPAATSSSFTQNEDRLLAGKTRFLADTRNNNIIVVTRSENLKYINEVIGRLDAESNIEQPFIRPLYYLSVKDAFPLLTDMLAAAYGDANAAGATANNMQGRTTTNNFNQQNNRATSFNQNTNTRGGNQSGATNRPDQLNQVEQEPPLSVSLGNDVSVMGDTSGNRIVVFGPPDVKARSRQILDLLDLRPTQVYISAVIGQMRIAKGTNVGTSYLIRTDRIFNGVESSVSSPLVVGDFLKSIPTGSGGGGGGGADVLPGVSQIITPSTMAALTGFTAYGAIGDSVDVFVRALETTNNFRVLARPSVYTTNNKKATILSGMRIPVPTSIYQNSYSGNDGNFSTNVTYTDVALKLEVIPLINAKGEVRLQIAQTNDNKLDSVSIGNGVESPVIGTQEISTDVIVPSGSTVILGGLITDEEAVLEDGLPYLSRIPVLKYLFGGEKKTREKYELVVMIQPQIVYSDDDLARVNAEAADGYTIARDFQAALAEPAILLPTDSPYPSVNTPIEVAQQKASTPKPVKAEATKAEPTKEELKQQAKADKLAKDQAAKVAREQAKAAKDQAKAAAKEQPKQKQPAPKATPKPAPKKP